MLEGSRSPRRLSYAPPPTSRPRLPRRLSPSTVTCSLAFAVLVGRSVSLWIGSTTPYRGWSSPQRLTPIFEDPAAFTVERLYECTFANGSQTCKGTIDQCALS